MRKVIILQARLASSRFPNKVLADLSGKPMIAHIIDRLRASQRADEVCVAIPADASDDRLAEAVSSLGVCLTRGSGGDVLGRYIQAAYETKADIIVRATADNPLVDPHTIDAQLDALAADPELDYVITDGLPTGVTTESFKLKTLEKLDFLTGRPGMSNYREHVTLYLRQHPGPFTVRHLQAPAEIARPDVSLSVNRPEHLTFIQAIYERLYREGELIEIGDVIGLLESAPELRELSQAGAMAAA